MLLQQDKFGALGFRAWCWLCWGVGFGDAMDKFRFSHVDGHFLNRTEHLGIISDASHSYSGSDGTVDMFSGLKSSEFRFCALSGRPYPPPPSVLWTPTCFLGPQYGP